MADDETRPLPVISEASTVRAKLGLLVGIACFLVTASVGAAAWATNMDNRAAIQSDAIQRQGLLIEEVRNWTHTIDRRLDRIEDHFRTGSIDKADTNTVGLNP